MEGNQSSRSFLAAALRRGERIPKGRFSNEKAVMAFVCSGYIASCPRTSGTARGNWLNATNRYLGLKFTIHGKIHYGWARLSVQAQMPPAITAILTGYAYETVPNKPIIAGKTHGKDVITLQDASLGHLARGASSIPAWRQREATGGTQ